jgi:hypothetical protein
MLTGVVAIFLGIDAEQKSLEDIAQPLGAGRRPTSRPRREPPGLLPRSTIP